MQSLCRQAFEHSSIAVRSSKLVTESVRYVDPALTVFDKSYQVHGRLTVVAFGKASLGMLRALMDLLGDRIDRAICSTPEPLESDCSKHSTDALLNNPRVSIFYGSKSNLPNDQVISASTLIYDTVVSLTSNDLLLVCISGGGSALLTLPKAIANGRITLTDIITITKLLSEAGADICELNIVRSHFDELKAGGLARLAHPAQIVSLIISDVIGDPLRFIASGPTYIDDSLSDRERAKQCCDILRRYVPEEKIPGSIRHYLKNTTESNICQKVSDYRVDNWIIGNNQIALQAAERFIKQKCGSGIPKRIFDVHTCILTHELSGEAGSKGALFAELLWHASFYLTQQNQSMGNPNEEPHSSARWNTLRILEQLCPNYDQNTLLDRINQAIQHGNNGQKMLVLLLGGETTVSIDPEQVKVTSIGGRCSHFALAAAIRWYELVIQNSSIIANLEITILVGATDGLDGPSAVGGGVTLRLAPDTVIDSTILYEEAVEHLKVFDSYGFFRKHCQNCIIQPKLTDVNVMDIIMADITVNSTRMQK